MADWDEDGDVDLLCGEYSGYITYFENIGSVTEPRLTDRGHIMAGGTAIDVGTLSIPVVHDWNEDGMKDLVVGNDPAYIRIYLNVGTNQAPVFNTYFQIATNPSITQIKNAPDIGDLNGDGLKDLAFGWWEGTVVYYPNSGTNSDPVFTGDHELSAVGTVIDPGGWTHLELNDWDEDGDFDLVYGEWNGEVYIHYNLTGEIEVELPYLSAPQIPAGGGAFDFTAILENNSEYAISCDVWTVAVLPNGGETGALLQAQITLPPGGSIDRDRTQNVPAAAPAGDYEYVLRMGIYPDDVWTEDIMPFEKLEFDGASAEVHDWECSGQSFDRQLAVENKLPGEPMLVTAYPNPFNNRSTIEMTVPSAGEVRLSVFDVQGRRVAELAGGYYSAGKHSVVFEAGDLTSGIYFIKYTALGQTYAQKLLLVK